MNEYDEVDVDFVVYLIQDNVHEVLLLVYDNNVHKLKELMVLVVLMVMII